VSLFSYIDEIFFSFFFIDLRFDPSACSSGLSIFDDNTNLRQKTYLIGNRTCRLMTTGWIHGIHYWSMRIISRGPFGRVVLGIVPGHFDISMDHYPGITADSFGFYIFNGNKYNNGQFADFSVESIQNGDVVGVLLDLDAKTLTYYKNGYLLGTAFGHLLTRNNTKFYPTVTFYDFGSWISLIKTFK